MSERKYIIHIVFQIWTFILSDEIVLYIQKLTYSVLYYVGKCVNILSDLLIYIVSGIP